MCRAIVVDCNLLSDDFTAGSLATKTVQISFALVILIAVAVNIGMLFFDDTDGRLELAINDRARNGDRRSIILNVDVKESCSLLAIEICDHEIEGKTQKISCICLIQIGVIQGRKELELKKPEDAVGDGQTENNIRRAVSVAVRAKTLNGNKADIRISGVDRVGDDGHGLTTRGQRIGRCVVTWLRHIPCKLQAAKPDQIDTGNGAKAGPWINVNSPRKTLSAALSVAMTASS